MLEEIKKIKLEELTKEKMTYEEKKAIISKNLEGFRNNLWQLEGEQSFGITIRGNFSFFEKWITRRNDYKKFKAQSKRFAELPTLINKAKAELEAEQARVEQELETSGINKKFNEIEQSMNSIENSKTLSDLGITPTEAIELLENNGIQPVLSESDKSISVHPRNYTSKSSLIGVHKTKYAPTANMIKSAKDSNVEYQKHITLNGTEYEYSYKSARDTIHLAMNDEVSSHLFGSWDDCKYAILIPFVDIPNEKIGRVATVDTFTRGSIELSENSWILCPKNEVEKLKIFNPKAHVLGYEGENVKGYSKPFLTQLGYRGEDVGMWNWADNESAKQFIELMQKEGLKIGTHTYTYFHEDEEILSSINQAVALSKLLRDNHLITAPEDIENIMEQLSADDYYQSFGSILSNLCTKSDMVEDVEPQSIKGNNKQVDIFLQEMENNGFNISPAYQNVLRRLYEVSIYDCNKNNSDIVFNIPEGTPEEEKKTIEELQAGLISDSYIDYDEKKSAFRKFISAVMGNTILHSQERNLSKGEVQEEKSL